MTVRQNRGLVRRSGSARFDGLVRPSVCAGGFTLIELLVVLSIVAILAAMIMPIGNSVARRRDENTCFFNLKTIGMALENYRQDFRGFPLDITETIQWTRNFGDEQDPRWEPRSGPGMGLYTLYVTRYLTRGPSDVKGREGYLKGRKFYHCPRNTVGELPDEFNVPGIPDDATLGGWNNYDGPIDDPRYRRVRPGLDLPDERQLIQPYPAPTTVVTWCDFHYRSGRSVAQPGDKALVLWVDQTADWVTVKYRDGTTVHPATATQKQALIDRQSP
jgi:prepilin-type N-terminal cleavage/methylation domain-containing protein